MFEDYTIGKAINEKEHLENLLEKKKEERSILMPLPKSGNMSNELVDGGIRTDKMTDYLIKANKLDIEIDTLKKEISMLKKYITKEKQRISKFNDWEQKIIYLREEHKTWLQIACTVPYSIRKCKQVYYDYKKK